MVVSVTGKNEARRQLGCVAGAVVSRVVREDITEGGFVNKHLGIPWWRSG